MGDGARRLVVVVVLGGVVVVVVAGVEGGLGAGCKAGVQDPVGRWPQSPPTRGPAQS